MNPEKIDKAEHNRVAQMRKAARNRPHLNISNSRRYSSRAALHWDVGPLAPANAIVAGDMMRRMIVRREEFEAMQGTVKRLVIRGKWAVPPEDRPHGWEKMGVTEWLDDNANQ